MRRSFDLVGDVAVIEAEGRKEEKELVERVTRTYPRVKTVLRKESKTKGKCRKKKYRVVFRNAKKIRESGLGETETIHMEHGCRYKLDLRKVFFNPREATVRNTITCLVTPREKVLVMFSGVGPYPILIAKRTGCRVVGVEANPDAHQYALENLRLNKVQEKVELLQGDVRGVELGKGFDRVIMPLGTEAWKYLDMAFMHCRKGGIIHVFGLGEKKNPWKDLEKKVKDAAKKTKKKVRVLDRRVVLPYSPALEKVCLDVKVV